MNELPSGVEDIGFDSVEGGEFWNLHVDVEAVVDPEEEEDDCNEEDEKRDSPVAFEILREAS